MPRARTLHSRARALKAADESVNDDRALAPVHPTLVPLRRLSELVEGDRAPARLRQRVPTVASGAKIIRAKLEFQSFQARAQPLLQALLDPINGRTTEDTRTLH
ncbi:hypothetical protein PIB30_106628, partial [Stylosanthes scabra]|nr:hypothetical protein [Stylosanthes scabra]